jgi:ubiquinone/menaquinone biosynthesis C-methylase UbiE
MIPSSPPSLPPDPRRPYFDQIAPLWDRVGPNPDLTLKRLHALRPRLALAPGLNLLEVGCGTGQITGWLLAQVQPGSVVAVDFSESMLAQAGRRGVETTFLLHDICAGPLPHGPFDVAFCFHVFPHFRDPQVALRHLAQALVPEGRLLVVHLSGRDALNAFHAGLDAPVREDRLPGATEWAGLLADAGFHPALELDRPDLFLLEARRAVSTQSDPNERLPR